MTVTKASLVSQIKEPSPTTVSHMSLLGVKSAGLCFTTIIAGRVSLPSGKCGPPQGAMEMLGLLQDTILAW